MSESVQAAPSRKRRRTHTTAEIQVQHIAREAAKLSKQHRAQFASLAALARTVQSSMPAEKNQLGDYALLAKALVDSAENYKNLAEVHDIAFSLVATDSLHLLQPNEKADILRRVNAADESPSAKRARNRPWEELA